MKRSHFLVAVAAVLAIGGCNAERSNETSNTPINIEPVPPPEGGDWSQTVTRTAEGGYLMGNPDARVKLIEFASMTCPACGNFERQGAEPLVENYVKTGNVSFELRNYVRDPFDLTASLLARCGGTERFFPLTRAMFLDQENWMNRLQTVPQEELEAAMNAGPQRQFVEIARLAGLQQWAAMRGVPSAASAQCLSDEGEINQLIQMNSDAVSTYQIPGTPSFVLNGELIENVSSWEALEPEIREALGG